MTATTFSWISSDVTRGPHAGDQAELVEERGVPGASIPEAVRELISRSHK